jgi:cysteinyl-tRNA synthetase
MKNIEILNENLEMQVVEKIKGAVLITDAIGDMLAQHDHAYQKEAMRVLSDILQSAVYGAESFKQDLQRGC